MGAAEGTAPTLSLSSLVNEMSFPHVKTAHTEQSTTPSVMPREREERESDIGLRPRAKAREAEKGPGDPGSLQDSSPSRATVRSGPPKCPRPPPPT